MRYVGFGFGFGCRALGIRGRSHGPSGGGAEFGEAEAFTAVGQSCVLWNPVLNLGMWLNVEIL